MSLLLTIPVDSLIAVTTFRRMLRRYMRNLKRKSSRPHSSRVSSVGSGLFSYHTIVTVLESWMCCSFLSTWWGHGWRSQNSSWSSAEVHSTHPNLRSDVQSIERTPVSDGMRPSCSPNYSKGIHRSRTSCDSSHYSDWDFDGITPQNQDVEGVTSQHQLNTRTNSVPSDDGNHRLNRNSKSRISYDWKECDSESCFGEENEESLIEESISSSSSSSSNSSTKALNRSFGQRDILTKTAFNDEIGPSADGTTGRDSDKTVPVDEEPLSENSSGLGSVRNSDELWLKLDGQDRFETARKLQNGNCKSNRLMRESVPDRPNEKVEHVDDDYVEDLESRPSSNWWARDSLSKSHGARPSSLVHGGYGDGVNNSCCLTGCCLHQISWKDFLTRFIAWACCVLICLIWSRLVRWMAAIGTLATCMLVYILPSMLYFRLGVASDFQVIPTWGWIPNRFYMLCLQILGLSMFVGNLALIVYCWTANYTVLK